MKIVVRIVAFVLFSCAAVSVGAQTQGVDILLSKARSLEARGRMDLAAQNWKQVLLANPNQTEALAGLARYAKENGQTQEERGYIDRLRKVNPKDPEIAAIEKMHVLTPQERDRLDQAGRLAMQHKPDEAMRIYNEVFGNQPPVGKWAEPYYETEAASTGGREKAVAQLRRLSASDPDNETYRLWLARILINDPKTRTEGLQKLESIHDPGAAEQARTLWRQALLWEKENPAVLSFVNAYLERYPDQELQGIQQALQQKQEHMAEEANKARGFQALRGKDLTTAEAKFQDVLRRSPNDPNAVAGLAFVRLNQKRFDDAVALFDRARKLSPKRADVQDGYQTAKFWSLMQRGETALQQNQPDLAIAAYDEALTVHPQDAEATLGLAQAYVKAKNISAAEQEFQQVLNQSPNNVDAIAGLAFLRVQEKKFDEAATLFDKANKLVPNRADLQQGYKDAKYWSLMQHGAAEMNAGHADAAIADYHQALAIRPGAADALHGVAGATERTRNYAQAAQAYQQLTTAAPDDPQNWLGLMRVQLLAKHAKDAIATSQRIPAAVAGQIKSRPDYLSELALAYYSAGQPNDGTRVLDQALAAAAKADSTEALNARLEIASQLMKQGQADRAIAIYQQATNMHPENTIAWEGLVGAYSQQRDYSRAKTAVRAMPKDVFNNAAKNSGFLNSVAAIYSADGDCSNAEDLLTRSLALDRSAGRQPAEGTQLQLADIWSRQNNYAKATQAYREVLARDQNSIEAWRGYLNVLHQQHNDRALVSESQRIPASVHAQLEKTPEFLVLLAGAQSNLGDQRDTLQLLQRARAMYVAQNQVPTADLDIQLAWAMLSNRQDDPRLFLQKVRAREDLTDKQRETIEQIWSTWAVTAADQAMKDKKPERAVLVLTDAQRALPHDPKIYGALASVYARQHEYGKAMDLYASWGMRGAVADDYRAAAGAALASHREELADFYLNQGIQNFPNDAGLLEMKGKRAIARGNYKEGETYLKSALRASKNPMPHSQSFMGEATSSDALQQNQTQISVPNATADLAPKSVPACKTTMGYARPHNLRHQPRLMLVSAAESPQDGGTQGRAEQDQAAPKTDSGAAKGTAQSTTVANNSASDPPAVNPQRSPEEQQRLQDEIDVVQNRNTPFGDFGSVGSGRAGDPGIDRLIIEDGFAGGSVVAGNRVRVDAQAHGLFLYSGTPNGQSKSRFGTLLPGAAFREQTTGGVTGELQISTGTFGLDFGATPKEFPVQNVIGGIRFRPLGGPITFTATRDSVKDSMLSYAGVRDPGTGIVWGGVVSNTGVVQFDHKNPRAGEYLAVGGSYLTGKLVPMNWSAFGSAGVYFVVVKGLSVGLGVTGIHYDKNLSFFSLGQGGYFSPQQYGLAAIPISWFSRHRRFEYEIRASLGAQYIQQDASLYFPTRFNFTLPTPGFYASTTDIGPNYSFLGRLGYRVAPHVYFDTFASASNARNYATQTVGFSLKFMVNRLPTHTDLHVDSVPDWKGDQPFGIE